MFAPTLFSRGSFRPLIRMTSTAASQGKLSGRVAVVTASTEGIGFAIAKRFAEDGAKVMISSRKQNNVDKALEALEAYNVAGTTCHVGKREDRSRLIKETIDKFGGIDILVLNAAVNPVFGTMLETPEEAWDKIFEINVKSPFLLTRDVVPIMEKRGGGSVIIVTSIGGYQPFELLGAYSVSKTALIGLVKALSPPLGSMNIRINGLAPGVVKTKFSSALWTNETFSKEALERIPLQRFAESDDISGAASFLASDDSSYITGETLVIAGGMPSRL